MIGLCRFCYLGEGGFQSYAEETIEHRRSVLYEPQRLELRLIWFAHVLLPALRAQKDQDFTLVILTGQDLPQPFRDRLEELSATLPQARLAFRPPGPHRQVCAEVIRGVTLPDADVVAQFRLDDDDAVATDYVATIRRDFHALSGIFAESSRLAVDYNLGVLLHDDGQALAGHIQRSAFWSCALTLYLAPGDPMQLLDFPHHRIWQQMPTLTRSGRPMFVRGSHGFNDSRIRLPSADGWTARARVEQLLQTRFNIDLAAFEAELARYRDRFGLNARGASS